MGKRLVFDGLQPDRHTWFDTRRTPEKLVIKRGPISQEMVDAHDLRNHEHVERAQAGGFTAKQDFEVIEHLGGDTVQAHQNSSFPLEYVDERFIEQHVRMGHAHVVDVPEPTSPHAPTAPAPQPEVEDDDAPPRGRGRAGG